MYCESCVFASSIPSQTTTLTNRRISIKVGAVVAIIIIVVAAIVAFVILNQPRTLLSSGTVIPIGTSTYQSYQLVFSRAVTITGAFSTTGRVAFYIMNPSQFSSYSVSRSATSSGYVYTTGEVSSGGTINTNLDVGTFYMIFENTDFFTSKSVTITQSIIATPH